MTPTSRKIIDKSFSAICFLSIAFMAVSLLVLLGPIVYKGISAFVFKGTVEYREFNLETFKRGDKQEINSETEAAAIARKPVFGLVAKFEKELEDGPADARWKYNREFDDLKEALRELFGPLPGDEAAILPRNIYGQTRWDRSLVKLNHILYIEEWDYSDPSAMGTKKLVPRKKFFEGTTIEPLFGMLNPASVEAMMRPKLTFYWRFIFDEPHDSNIFGGIWPAVLGTLYLTLGAMLFAVPAGIIAAIYLVEYSRETTLLSLLRSCISTLAGVPSIVFGLFGLAFFINSMHVSESKSVLAGSLTLGLLILPTIIRASEEAIRAVPIDYKQAAMGLGASRWWTVVTVILPAALPGILTGIVISMGRAAGETAPIIFTAAVSVGRPLSPTETLSQPTPALPWNIYNLCTEHEAVDEIRHVQFGMVLTLVSLVLALNLAAVLMRARIERNLKG